MKWILPSLCLLACGGGSVGEVDLVIANQSQTQIVVGEGCLNDLQIIDAAGARVMFADSCPDSYDLAYEPFSCVPIFRWIQPGSEKRRTWRGFMWSDGDCGPAPAGRYEAELCYGTDTEMVPNEGLGESTTIVKDPVCKRVAFELGIDLEAKAIAD